MTKRERLDLVLGLLVAEQRRGDAVQAMLQAAQQKLKELDAEADALQSQVDALRQMNADLLGLMEGWKRRAADIDTHDLSVEPHQLIADIAAGRAEPA